MGTDLLTWSSRREAAQPLGSTGLPRCPSDPYSEMWDFADQWVPKNNKLFKAIATHLTVVCVHVCACCVCLTVQV